MPHLLALLALCGLAIAPAPGRGAEELDLQGVKTLFESKCSRCHSVDRPLRKRKDRSGWEKTVRRMKRYASGTITDEDAAKIVDYLLRARSPEK